MKSFAAALVCLGLATAPALGADYDTTEKSPLCELHLRVPATAMAIAPLKEKILTLYKADAEQAKSDAKEDKEGNPSFHPYSIDTVWRVTFESDAMLSLSADINADQLCSISSIASGAKAEIRRPAFWAASPRICRATWRFRIIPS